MTLHTGWLAPQGQTRQATRHIAVGATTPVGTLGVRSGILPGTNDGKYRVGGLWMSGNGPMTATVYAGRAVVQGPSVQGAYPVTLDQDTPITFADGDPLNPRIDLVVLRVYDDQFDSSKRSEAAVEIVKGTPAAAAVAPAAPPLSLPLFHVKVQPGASAGSGGILWTAGALTDLRVTTTGVGGILPVYNNSAVPGAYPGQYQDNDDAHLLQRWNGSGWVAYPKEVGGIAPNGALPTGSYPGQFRETNGVLQRWNGTGWATYHPPVEVETTTTPLNAYGGWTAATVTARRTRGIATIRISVDRSGADITAGANGYLTDQQMCALPPGWYPPVAFEAMAMDTMATGVATINGLGVVTLRSWTPTAVIRSGGRMFISATYVL